VENTANDLDREAHRPQAIRGAASAAPRQARLAVNQEVRKLIADVEDLIRRVGDAADPELARLRSKVESTIATTRKAVAEGAEQAQRQAEEALGFAALAGVAVGFLLGRR